MTIEDLINSYPRVRPQLICHEQFRNTPQHISVSKHLCYSSKARALPLPRYDANFDDHIAKGSPILEFNAEVSDLLSEVK